MFIGSYDDVIFAIGEFFNQRKSRTEKTMEDVCFGLVLWHINHCRLFNAESVLYDL